MKRLILCVAVCTSVIILPAANSPAASGLTKQAGPEKNMTTSSGIELVWIPPGDFMMGSTPAEKNWAFSGSNGGRADVNTEGEKPQSVQISKGFWMGRTVVTVANSNSLWKQRIS